MSKIIDIHARQVLDSRGNPTVEAEITTENGFKARASVPSGASTGKYEAVELRDGDEDTYLGKGVLKAITNIKTVINQELKGIDVNNQILIDNKMIDLDGTSNKSFLGANAMLAVSLACAKSAAAVSNKSLYSYIGGSDAIELPIPMMNILNGGSHADNSIDFQEFMVMPIGAHSFSQALQMGTEVFHYLKDELKNQGYSTNVGDEGGFAPNLQSNEQAIEVVLKAIESAGYRPGEDMYIAMDAAASEFYNREKKIYHLHQSTGDKLTPSEMIDYWLDWTNKYPIISIEDGLDEDDWSTWKELTAKIGDKVQLVGDDLFVTNVQRLEKGIKNGDETLEISLKPRNLGNLKISLSLNNDSAKINIVTENSSAALLLSEAESKLSQMLENTGLKLSNLSTSSEQGKKHNTKNGNQDNTDKKMLAKDEISLEKGDQLVSKINSENQILNLLA